VIGPNDQSQCFGRDPLWQLATFLYEGELPPLWWVEEMLRKRDDPYEAAWIACTHPSILIGVAWSAYYGHLVHPVHMLHEAQDAGTTYVQLLKSGRPHVRLSNRAEGALRCRILREHMRDTDHIVPRWDVLMACYDAISMRIRHAIGPREVRVIKR
jgi:hypothetical protein